MFLLDPLVDTRWDDLVERHPRASVFHTREWLEALERTYGFRPIVLTTTQRGTLRNGLVLCHVRTSVSNRLVSLPFSDYCDPLLDAPDDLFAMLAFLADEMPRRRWGWLELRPRCLPPAGLTEGVAYHLHTLDLARPAEQVFKGFHASCTRRAIRRAEREGLTYAVGRSEWLMERFYGLLRMTRRRHGLPPQPVAWFQNLVRCLSDRLTVHLVSKDGVGIAGMLTLSFKKTLVYKYGGSDARFHRLGAMPFIFWRAIEWAKAHGIEELDLGRCDLDQPGLATFKDHLGATRSSLTYYTWPGRNRRIAHDGPLSRAARQVLAHLPDSALDLTGRLLYKHLG